MEAQPFFDFIRFSIGSQKDVPQSAGGIDWGEFFEFCNRQSIQGIVFRGIEQANPSIPQVILFNWIGSVEHIKALNRLTNKRTKQISQFWTRQGHRNCILKGQANALMYPHPELRTPGDIDIWVEGADVEITRTVLKEVPNAHYSFHHVKMPVFDDVSVEVHYRPAYMSIWWKDKKLQELTISVADRQFENTKGVGDAEFKCLTDDFNALFLIIHMFGHCFSSHNNFKQLIDYYYLLKRGLSIEQKDWVKRQFEMLGVEKYAAGIMWIEQEILGLEKNYLIVEPNKNIGKLLLGYVVNYGARPKRSKISLLLHRITDNLPLVRYFPSTVMIGPIYLIWHQWWKLNMSFKLRQSLSSEALDELQNINTEL